jgi:hypothetical protein
MLNSYEGIYEDGKIQFVETPPTGLHGKVIVTFLATGLVNLADRGIDESHAADLRNRLKTIAVDWDRPEMDVYDAV